MAYSIIVLYQSLQQRRAFYPLTIMRPAGELWSGMLTGVQAWHRVSNLQVFCFGNNEIPVAEKYYCIQAGLQADLLLAQEILNLQPNQGLSLNGELQAWCSLSPPTNEWPVWIDTEELKWPVRTISSLYELLQLQTFQLATHFEWLTQSKTSASIGLHNQILGNQIFVESGVQLQGAIIDATEGPIFIAKNALIMPGAYLRGPLFIGENSVIKMGATIYGGTTIAHNCIVGGEVKNAVLLPFSNKAHHGYLGDSYIGSWCNWGAGTSNSNVKNSGGTVRTWNQALRAMVNTGNKCGCFMGDYSRTAINTAINTGTYIGVGCSLHLEGLTPSFIPSFSFGLQNRYEKAKLIRDITNWKMFKQQPFEDQERQMIDYLFDHLPD